jgi:glutamate-ammonia-ligase adenylyltransferase
MSGSSPDPAPLVLLLDGPPGEAEAWLAAQGFEEPGAARRALQAVFRQANHPATALPFLDRLLARLPACPDPDRALIHTSRWVAQLASSRDTLATLVGHPRLLDDLLLLFGTSDYLADILVREPTAYALLLDDHRPTTNDQRPTTARAMLATRLSSAVDLFTRSASRLDALRRFKRREFLQIAWRDLTGRDDFEAVVRAISDLADAIIAKALAVCRDELTARTGVAPLPFAVIGMGKLGARELNYSSDVDLIFLSDVPPGDERAMRSSTRLAEELVAALSQPTGEGHLYRVDMRLRPEGRYGALVRTPASYREYYDRWMETWERQALIKARFIAGDAEMGVQFEAMIEPRVYRRVHSTAIFEDVRDVKRLIERRVSEAGQAASNVKEGRGTIRDIEFAVQLLQLLFGGEHSELRARDSLTAMSRLKAAGLLTADEARALSDHYAFFRTVEHRLQLMDDLPVRLLPESPGEQRKLARRLGYPPVTADRFMTEYANRADEVRRITGGLMRRLGHSSEENGSPLRALVLALGEEQASDEALVAARDALALELDRLGFLEAGTAVETVGRLVSGGPRLSLPVATRRVVAELAETLLPQAGASPDPEGALRIVEDLARRKGTYQTFYRTLQEQPEMRAALCAVAGSSPWIAEEITRRPELLDVMTDPEFLAEPHSLEELLAEARRRRDLVRGKSDRRNALRRFRKRELLRIAARDLSLGVPPVETTAELARLADACVHVGLELAAGTLFPEQNLVPAGFAVIGLGRLGGEEMHYSSDLDLLYLYDERPDANGISYQEAESLATELSGVLQDLTEEGRLYEIDLRLRPEGKSALLVVHLDAARKYYGPGGRSQTWEKQSLIKTRFIAGDSALVEEFLAVVEPEVFPLEPPPERDAEVRAMKRRIERERVRDAERDRHLKLGPGGLSDIEFLVQLLQLRHGGRSPELRVRNTTAALAALGERQLLPPEEAATLAGNYAFLTCVRQRLYLRSTGVASDLFPTDPLELRRLARTMELPDGERLQQEYTRRTEETRRLFLTHFQTPKPAETGRTEKGPDRVVEAKGEK